MIETTITVKGVRLDVQHDGEIVHAISPHTDSEYLLGILSEQAKRLIYTKLYATGKIRSIPPILRHDPSPDRKAVTL
jgi:hypothetical protein